MPVKSVYPLWHADALRTGRTVDSQAVSDGVLLWDSEKWHVGNWAAVGQWKWRVGWDSPAEGMFLMDSHTVRNGWLFSSAAFLLTGGWLSLAEAATRIIFIATKKRFLSRQNYACRDKHIFVAINVCRDKYLLRQTSFCLQDKLTSVATNICRNKSFVEASILLSWQKACFVATNTCLLRQTRVCRDKNYTYGSSRQW